MGALRTLSRRAHPPNMNELRRAALLASLSVLCACNVRLVGSDTTITVEGVVRSNGQSITGALLSANGTEVTTGSTGAFTLRVKLEKDRVPIDVSAKGYAPTVLLIHKRDSIYHYYADVELTAPQRKVMQSSTTQTVTLTAGDQTITVEVPPDAIPPGATLELTAIAAENGPGGMETTESADELLQTGAMLYVRAVDMAGNEVAITGTTGLTVTPGAMTDIGMAGVTKTYALTEDAVWKPTTTMATPRTTFPVLQTGFRNVDRNFRTVCVRGRLKAPRKSCGGQKVMAGGRNALGLFSSDTAGAGGTFCLESPAGFTRTLIVGSTMRPVTFPRTFGSCRTNPTSCTDLGDVPVADADCPKSCDLGQQDGPGGCQNPGEPGGGTGGGSGGGGGGSNVGCGPPSFGGGCSSLGSSFTAARLGNGCCSWSTCERGGQLGSCSDGCSNGWYEAQGRIFGPCNVSGGANSCLQNAASAAINACMR